MTTRLHHCVLLVCFMKRPVQVRYCGIGTNCGLKHSKPTLESLGIPHLRFEIRATARVNRAHVHTHASAGQVQRGSAAGPTGTSMCVAFIAPLCHCHAKGPRWAICTLSLPTPFCALSASCKGLQRELSATPKVCASRNPRKRLVYNSIPHPPLHPLLDLLYASSLND